MKTLLISLLLLTVVACQSPTNNDEQSGTQYTYHELELANGTTLYFAVIIPDNLDPDKAYPVLITFPPGDQNYERVQFALDKYWIISPKNQWIVISPIAPDGLRFYQGGEATVPELMQWIEDRYNVEGGKFHVAGLSAGGYSSFRVAIDYFDRVLSVLVFPGYPPGPADPSLLHHLKNMPVVMYVGGADGDWVTAMNTTYTQLQDAGVDVTYTVLPGQQHVIDDLSPQTLYGILNTFRPSE